MSFITTIENDLAAAWGALENVAVSDAELFWSDAKAVWTALLPAQWTILSGFFAKAMLDVETGNFADIETNILNQAAAEEIAWVANFGSQLLQAIIAIMSLTYKAPAAAPKAA